MYARIHLNLSPLKKITLFNLHSNPKAATDEGKALPAPHQFYLRRPTKLTLLYAFAWRIICVALTKLCGRTFVNVGTMPVITC